MLPWLFFQQVWLPVNNLQNEGSEPSDKEEEGDGSKSSSEGDEGETRRSRKRKLSLDERRAERAAGTHPLQQQFKKLSSRLLKKHTGQASGGES